MDAGIVGVDPGTTSAVAIVNLDGDVLAIEARRDWSIEEMTRFISDRCNAVVIASDVAGSQGAVDKIASTLNAKVWSPPRNLLVAEKTRIAQRKNAHERDSLAAAKKAHEAYHDLIVKAKRTSAPNEVFSKIVKNEAANIVEATTTKVKLEQRKRERKGQDIELIKMERDTLRKQVNALMKENKTLMLKLKKGAAENERLRKKKPSPNKEITKLKIKIETLEKRIKAMRRRKRVRKVNPDENTKKQKNPYNKGWLKGLIEEHKTRNKKK